VVSAGAGDRSSWVWDATTGKDVLELKVGDNLSSLAFSADGKKIVTGSPGSPRGQVIAGAAARLWDAESGRMIAELPHNGPVQSAGFSPDLRRLVTASLDWHVRVWNVADGVEVARMRHDYSVSRAVFSPDGRYVLSAASDKTARLWDATTGKELFRFAHAPRGVAARPPEMIAAHFSADGRRVLTISTDATARMWDTATGKELGQLRHGASVLSAAFSGDRLATGSFDNMARVWNIPWLLRHDNDLIASACAERPTAARRLTPEDVRMAPLLSGRVGEDVCRE
jgi:WD40 repeat protein